LSYFDFDLRILRTGKSIIHVDTDLVKLILSSNYCLMPNAYNIPM